MIAIVLISEWASAVSVLEGLGGLAVIITGASMLFCHEHGCYRRGRFPHRHYRFCHIHHPDVPSDGRITAEHLNTK